MEKSSWLFFIVKQKALLNYSIENKQSKIDGTGAFSLQPIPARKKIGNLGGEIIPLREARKRAAKTKRVAMVEFGDGRALDASVNPNQLRYINHSCNPNTYMRVAFAKVEFYTLRPIKKGEELTCNYGPTHHDGKLKCACGAINCKGYL
jgi:SET domain-containing protein